MNNQYKDVIFTNHALERLRERGISQGDAWATFKRPDQSRYAKSRGAWIYYKRWGDEKIEVVAKQNEQKEWIILTVWSKPVFETKHRRTGDSVLRRIFKAFTFLLSGKHP